MVMENSAGLFHAFRQDLGHESSLLSTPLPFWTCIITLGKKNDDEKTLLLKIIWL